MKVMRLSKVAKELNIGISTIRDFLKENGKTLDNNPNAKMQEDVYLMLLEEFQTEKTVKEESQMLGIDVKVKETILMDKDQEAPVVEEETAEPPVAPAKPETFKAKPEKEIEVKVVGKVDVEPAKKKKAAPVEEKPPVEKEEKKEEPELEKPKEPIIEAKSKKLSGPKVVGSIKLPVKDPNKKLVASSSENAIIKKKKRKRIKKDKPVSDGGKRANPGTGTKGAKPKWGKAELSEEDISKQIKETLSRLSDTSKSKSVKYRKQKREAASEAREKELEIQEEEKKTITATEFVSANELSSLINVPVNDIIKSCMELGMFVSINQRLDAETISIVAEEFGYKVNFVSAIDQEQILEEEDAPEELIERAPIITVMGHVDHGKTSLLDYIRKSNVIGGEAGGITQHIGAYEVSLDNGKKIAFLDTPGHEAFTAMRARGAQVTDVAIIIVAADDSIMPQTVEAINHAQAAGVPIVFAINKMDKPNANADKIKEELSNMNILVEDWGGKYQCQEISAKEGDNIDELLEKVLLESELLELKANPNKKANGTVIESSLDKGKGYIVTLLVKNGTLNVGDIVVAGSYSGKVKALFNERGTRIKTGGPSTPVLMLGLNGAPQSGDTFNVLEDEREAKEIATKRMQLLREQGIRTQKHITLDEIGRRIAIGEFKELNVIIKGDVDGSIEALTDSILKLSTDQIQLNIIHKSVGQIIESDVLLASASDAIIIGFQVRPSAGARKLAETEQIDIRLYSVIYDAINELKDAMEGMLSPDIEEKIVCNVEIREVFKISKVGTIAGCMVTDGKITRNTNVRIIRDGIVAYTGVLGSLKRFKDDAKEVAAGYECGLNINNFNDIKVGDTIEGYEEVEIKKTLQL